MTKMNQSKAKSSTTKNNLIVRQVTTQDDLSNIAAQCNNEDWGDDSELLTYSEASLLTYLKDADNILVGVFDDSRIAGIAIGYVLLHPSGNKTLYIDELDAHPDYRRQGVGTMIMQKFQTVAQEKGCSEVWLSTSKPNHTAQAFYQKLQPTEEKEAIIYGYNI